MNIYIFNLLTLIIVGNILCFGKKLGKIVFIIYCSIQLILICGLRSEYVGTDTFSYINIYFRNVSNTPFTMEFFEKFDRETGYYLLCKIISIISDNYSIFLLIMCLIPIILISTTIYKYSVNIVLSVALFVGLRAYAFLFTGIRQSIALGICFYSFKYIKERKLFRFIICVLFASTFHKSAVIYLFSYFIPNIKLNSKNFLLSLFLISLTFLLRNPILSFLNIILVPLGYNYEGDLSFADGRSTIIIYSIVLLISLIFRKKIIKQDYFMGNTLINFIFISVFFYILGYIVSPFTRIAIYFSWFITIIIPFIINNIFYKNKDRYLINLIIYALLLMQYIYFGPGSSLLPYRFFWEENWRII